RETRERGGGSPQPAADGASQLRPAHGDERGARGGAEGSERDTEQDGEPDHRAALSDGAIEASTGGRCTAIRFTRRRTTCSTTRRYPSTSIDSPERGTRPNSASTSPPTVLTSSRSKLCP